MSFMKPQVEYGGWYEIDGPQGSEIVPADVVGNVWPFPYVKEVAFDGPTVLPNGLSQYCENRTCYAVRYREGWGARLSAPGYLDCTEWAVFDTEAEAEAYLRDTYPTEEGESDEA